MKARRPRLKMSRRNRGKDRLKVGLHLASGDPHLNAHVHVTLGGDGVEVGADDAIADVIGACTALHSLAVDGVKVLPVTLGYAVTAIADSTVPGTPRGREGLYRLWEAVSEAPKPAVVVIKDVGPEPRRSCHCGDVMANASSPTPAMARTPGSA